MTNSVDKAAPFSVVWMKWKAFDFFKSIMNQLSSSIQEQDILWSYKSAIWSIECNMSRHSGLKSVKRTALFDIYFFKKNDDFSLFIEWSFKHLLLWLFVALFFHFSLLCNKSLFLLNDFTKKPLAGRPGGSSSSTFGTFSAHSAQTLIHKVLC